MCNCDGQFLRLFETCVVTPEEKELLVERLRLEIEIRKELTPKREHSRWAWMHSNLTVLVIGAILSGALIPLFQYSQETIKWKRQNRFENVKYRIGAMRDALRDAILMNTFAAEGYQLARPLTEDKTRSAATRTSMMQAYAAKEVDLNVRRYQQAAKVSSQMVFFPRRAALTEEFNKYLVQLDAYLTTLRKRATGDTDVSPLHESVLNEAYGTFIELLLSQIQEAEDASERFM